MGVKARYKIPAFMPLAGLVPICSAVRVHIEHCAVVVTGLASKAMIRRENNIYRRLFISIKRKSTAKSLKHELARIYLLG